jgi:hypothetical protein
MVIITNHDAYPNSQWLSLLMMMFIPIIIDSIIIDHNYYGYHSNYYEYPQKIWPYMVQ